MAKCADSNCGYYWQEAGEEYPRCHYNDPWPAPCEYDDDDEYIEDCRFEDYYDKFDE